MDEFQDYVAQEGSAQTLSEMLSECRKFGLQLILAHQNHSQLSERLQGALENAQLKVIFGVGRQTAQSLVGEVFRPAGGTAGAGVAWPRGPTLAEQWEGFIQQAQRLGRREMLVQLPEQEGVRRLRTCTVPPTKLDAAQREALQKRLARQSGQAVAAMRRALATRERRTQVEEYETIEGGRHD
jgi:hypothetical protein